MGSALVAMFVAFSCASTPPPREVTLEERIREDNRIGQEIAPDFESKINLRRDVEVSVYLRNVATRLSEVSPELRAAPLGIFLIQDADARTWRNFGLPGNRVYLSVSLLKGIEYENELAGLIAMELSHILNRHVLARLKQNELLKKQDEEGGLVEGIPSTSATASKKPDYFGGSGVFSFTDENTVQSAETAVTLMYKAGYDPRGIVALWNRYGKLGAKSPYEAELLSKLTEKSREVIAGFAPLRNPVVRSDAFLSMKRRIERL